MKTAPARLQLQASIGTHRGDREYQQDRVEVLAHPRQRGVLLAVVADGMGGRSGGRMAADQVIITATQLFERYIPGTDDPQELLRTILQEAHTMIRLTAISAEQEPHSTAACVLLHPDGTCCWAHVGDTRIHLFRQGQLQRRTRDHSYVQDLVDSGELTEAMARNHPMSNVLTASLGTAEDPPLCLDALQLQGGDALLLCTDGVWHYFGDHELGATVDTLEPREACETLIGKARLRAGGRGDNLSLAVIRLIAQAPPPPPPRPPRLEFPPLDPPAAHKPGKPGRR
ncbi:MAG: serine/threonine-protein phosphatase [Betaproteobacteria bacterium]|nr:serine/threonine-protein phosphatase [Betaproteobacteria bacterium]MBU6513025.1 serine/threonine-protein phosphatase [Betaproteobacteria bacterium]MDE1955380.1 serine/threonine-protein phosphatase [Betaproteobacteria bacterium]MDE2153376.1 serine/threonine-protein phosphatase [Betaproteobacteria bacterium]MDE2477791.1 serine/threonine-protein phosphatase [Betaproteobacteria bacterium]